ncbi:MAG: OprO/OprP family phosphate-selective porin, partial [Prevotellaceae bacterium]|nr:OprO/OprP family phosphate-selective porin [Prevotellaceae bacterium]
MPVKRKITTALGALLLATSLQAQSYLPEIHGTIRTKFEYQTEMHASRFEVRNARVSFAGKVLPVVSYKLEIDLCDEGKMKMLDVYARFTPIERLRITVGHTRVPFTIDAFRSPHLQYFSNRSFIAKQVGNLRDIGVLGGYELPTDAPVTLEAGLFNGRGLDDQKKWNKQVSYAAKAQIDLARQVNITLSTLSVVPGDVRISSYNAGAYYQGPRLHLESEYIYKTYADHTFADVHALNAFINYDIPLRRLFRKLSLLGRYDMMTNQSDGKTTRDDGVLATTDHKRHRATGGLTLSLGETIQTDIRLN